MRHGEREDVVSHTHLVNTPLTRSGIEYATSQGESIHKCFEHVESVVLYTSPFRRCVETALAVAGERIPEVVVDRRLWEVWEEAVKVTVPNRTQVMKETIDAVEKDLSETLPPTCSWRLEKHNVPSTAETRAQSEQRFVQTITSICDENVSSDAIIVSHGNAVGSILSATNGDTAYEIAYCGYIVLERGLDDIGDGHVRVGPFEVTGTFGVETIPNENYGSISPQRKLWHRVRGTLCPSGLDHLWANVNRNNQDVDVQQSLRGLVQGIMHTYPRPLRCADKRLHTLIRTLHLYCGVSSLSIIPDALQILTIMFREPGLVPEKILLDQAKIVLMALNVLDKSFHAHPSFTELKAYLCRYSMINLHDKVNEVVLHRFANVKCGSFRSRQTFSCVVTKSYVVFDPPVMKVIPRKNLTIVEETHGLSFAGLLYGLRLQETAASRRTTPVTAADVTSGPESSFGAASIDSGEAGEREPPFEGEIFFETKELQAEFITILTKPLSQISVEK